jgi:heme-degrading monooxygenase HmoA
MFARILEFELKWEKKEEFRNFVKKEVIPILKKQPGFLEMLPFFPENTNEKKYYTISLWATKADATRYETEWYPKVYEMLKPYLNTPFTVKYYMLETTLCEHFAETFVA